MSIWKNFPGVVGALFGIGGSGASGHAIKNETYGLSVRDVSGSTLQNLGIAFARAGQDTDAATYRDAKETQILVEFSFTGASPPSPGTNSGSYGICHTSGGIYTAGALYYDNGSTLALTTSYKSQRISTKATVSFSGTVSMIANGSYVAESATAPYNWTLKGDGGLTNTGYAQRIAVPIALISGVTSTTSIPANSRISNVIANVTTAYPGGVTIQVATTGSTPLVLLDTTENVPSVVGAYSKEQDTLVQAVNVGSVIVSISGAPGVGAGRVIVEYVQNFLG